MSRCPSAEELELLLAEQLSILQCDTIAAHVEDCNRCQQQLAQMAADSDTVRAPVFREHLEFGLPEDFLHRLKQMSPPNGTGTAGDVPLLGLLAQQPPANEIPARDLTGGFERRRLGPYEILEKLGKGGMGVVYRAMHVELGKVVALKVLPAMLMDEVGIARFKNEVRAIGRLDHPNIVGTHDAGQYQGVHFLVMAYVDGMDLARLLDRHRKLSVPDACEVVRQAAAGLQHAFGHGLVHRDIKPSNLLLARDGLVKVVDLGLARSLADSPVTERLTATGTVLGTADYLAPEQWESPHTVDIRADVYSLGCTLYHLIAACPPFAGPQYNSVLQKMRAHQEMPPPSIAENRPEVPASLAAVLERMLAKDPADRFPTPGDVVEELRPFTTQANLAALLENGPPDRMQRSAPVVAKPALELLQPTQNPEKDRSPHSAVPARKRAWRQKRLPLILVSFCLAAAIMIALRPGSQRAHSSHVPLKILAMDVHQYRGELADPLGNITATTQVIRPEDVVRVSVRLSTPAYCYLIAFNPDGTEQLCYPEDPDLPVVNYPDHKESAQAMATPPATAREFQYPRGQFFEPGVPGLQAFVLVASTKPLPPYAQWRSKAGSIPWHPGEYHQPWRWHFDGQSFVRLPTERGLRVARGVPAEFKGLCAFFQSHPQCEAVQALAFPVTRD